MADMLTCIPVTDVALTCVLKITTVLTVCPDPPIGQDQFQTQEQDQFQNWSVEWLNQTMSSVKVLHWFLLQ